MDYLWLVLFFVVLVGIFWFFYVNFKKYVDERFSWFQQRLENISEPLFSVKERLSDLQDIKKDLTKLYITEEVLKGLSEDVAKLNAIFLSRKSGKAGERAVEEVLGLLPPNLLVRNLKMGASEVEFAFVLREGKYLPVDSKVTSPEILTKEELSEEELKELIKRIKKRAKEIINYTKDEKSVGFAVMTVPDRVYDFCKFKLLEELEKDKIILVPYGLLLSFLMFVFFFWERFGEVIEASDFSGFIVKLEKGLYEMERDIEQLFKELRSVENLSHRVRNNLFFLKRELEKTKISSD
ncbi:DNA recombination protein RmuC [Thermodesulfobacterium hveragerdense]|uniref:DNA recombination protein RmuC n=1 Tax=Thermodesulfobacterium hveragerdense TaxID=53424 RepID=UPI0003F9D192|nr:DNA recombination protein RmuC [Thermodesulfobacterium hveragerdense]